MAKKKTNVKKRSMKKESTMSCCSTKYSGSHACGGALYFVGFIGAVVYYLATATGFWSGVLGILKALVWPAFLVYGLLAQIGM